MIGRREFGLVGLSALSLSAMGAVPEADAHKHNADFNRCAKACGDCQQECDACAHHCGTMLGNGKKDHLASLQACLDCADICAAAARIVARSGVYANIICAACADACTKCGAECEKHTSDQMMIECAKPARHAPRFAARW